MVVDGKSRTHELKTSDVPFRRSIVVRGKGFIAKDFTMDLGWRAIALIKGTRY